MMDRNDIQVEVPRVDYEKFTSERRGEPSSAIRDRVDAVRQRQAEQFQDSELYCIARMGAGEDDLHPACLAEALQYRPRTL